jgi:osmoprotectant transport system substrate-binding protein
MGPPLAEDWMLSHAEHAGDATKAQWRPEELGPQRSPVLVKVLRFGGAARRVADRLELPAAPLNDTYAIAVNSAFAKESGIKTLSQMSDYIAKNPAAGSLCVENEVLQRDDGLSGMKTAYAMQGLQSKLMGVAVVYSQVAEGKACNFGEIYSTDGRIGSLDLVTLTDDNGFFKTYTPAPTLRLETLTKYPELKTLLEPVIAKLDTQTMTRLNAEAAAGKSPRDVAITWLQANGFIG